MQAVKVPNKEASAQEVREYISSLLSRELRISNTECETITKLWRYGRGHELRTFNQETISAIFGAEIGSIIYIRMQGSLKNSMNANRAGLQPICL